MLSGVTLQSCKGQLLEFAVGLLPGREVGAKGADSLLHGFSSPGYITPEELHPPVTHTFSLSPGAFRQRSFSAKVYFGSCFRLTYIKHSHKTQTSCGVQGGLLALCAFSVSRVRNSDELMPIAWS